MTGDDDERWLLRYRYLDGSLQAALPLRMVEATPARRVGWLAPGTQISYWALPDGSDPRSRPLAQRFAGRLTTARRTWEGSGVLRVLLPGRPYQVLHFWRDGAFRGWYVNFETPAVWTGAVVESRDLHLDLWIDTDGLASWKDEDEAAAALAAGHLLDQDVEVARHQGGGIVADLDAFLADVGDWRGYRPPDGWDALPLPPRWDAADARDVGGAVS